MDSNLKQLLSELNVSDDDRTRLDEAGVCTLVKLATFDHGAHFHKDSQLTEHIKKLNENQLIIICSPDPLLHAREILGLPTTTTQIVRSDALPTTPSCSTSPPQLSSEDPTLQRPPLNNRQTTPKQSNELGTNKNFGGGTYISNSNIENLLVHEGHRETHEHTHSHTHNNDFSKNYTFDLRGANNIMLHFGSTCLNITKEDIEIFRKRREFIKEGTFHKNGLSFPTRSMTIKNGDLSFIDEVQAEGYNIQLIKSLPKNDYYPINATPKALLLNNFYFSDLGMNCGEYRHGAESDSIKLAVLLKQLGFYVERQENQKAVEIKQIVQEFIKSCKDASMVLVFIGSHGGGINNADTFLGSDNKPVSFKWVVNCFNETNFPELKGKPKIFFTQFCRKKATESSIGYFPSALPITFNERGHDFKDMLVVHSTAPGNASFRDTDDGTWFVSAFIKVVEENAKREHLYDMLLKVNELVTVREEDSEMTDVQMCHIESTLIKKIYFIKPES